MSTAVLRQRGARPRLLAIVIYTLRLRQVWRNELEPPQPNAATGT